MNLELVNRIANTVLYEGYILYPYRPSAMKNQRRFNFGVLVPPEFSDRESGSETSVMQTQCLVAGSPQAEINVRIRFLQVEPSPTWQEAVEREVSLGERGLGDLAAAPRRQEFHFPPVEGAVVVSVLPVQDDLFKVSARIFNNTAMGGLQPQCRDEVLPLSLASTHTILSVKNGEFVSLLDPPEALREAAAGCRNSGAWPVLVGDAGERDVMLSSPIILYDYPQIAAESPGDLFDGAEIDEILTLRILTMTDEEKSEMRQSGDRARRILERTESLPEEQFLRLHGVLRGMRHPGEEAS